jgi:hypothetical protein
MTRVVIERPVTRYEKTYDGPNMHDRSGKHDHTRIINRQVVK